MRVDFANPDGEAGDRDGASPLAPRGQSDPDCPQWLLQASRWSGDGVPIEDLLQEPFAWWATVRAKRGVHHPS
ncbi:MAG TPA: hypothetical protein VH084_12000 [Mycobacterium sp.]|nr:hypothetical protein [Mycobacterium sp.]